VPRGSRLLIWPRVVLRRYRRLAGILTAALAAASLPGVVHAQSENAAVCAGCHKNVWESYRRTGMGRSFYRPSPETMVEDFTHKNTFYHQPSDSYFTMLQRDGKYYQRRYQIDSSGKQVNVMEKQIDYVMGSGNHSRAYLHQTAGNALVELPLAWYAEKGGYWAMNPGYDRPDHDGFRRPITYDCMFCHNAYPAIPPGHELPFAQAVYAGALPEGIDCQRCHGPGSRHAKLAATAGAKREDIRAAITNPSRLNAQRQMEVCMQCHLETTSFPLPNAIQRYERGPFSYRPGEPLSDFILNFDHAPGTGRDDKFEIVNAAYRLRRSACFLKSNGPESKSRMLCTTCHNPHDIPRGEDAARHYTAVCRQCHASSFDQQVAAGKHTRATACVDCHMPKRRTEDVVHVVATDHYIQRQKPAADLLAERPERQETGANAYRGPVVLYYPETLLHTPENELDLAVAQVKQSSNLAAGIERLTAAITKYSPARAEYYLELADALQNSGQLEKALAEYREAVRRNPKFAFGLLKLGTALRRSGQYPEAAEVLRRAASMEPERAVTWHELGMTYQTLGKSTDAVTAISRAVALDPDLPEAHNNLGIIWFAEGQQARAETAFREAIGIRPAYADAHGNLANLLSGAGNLAEARDQFEIALRLRPGDAATRYNYAMLLGRTGRFDEAQRELEACLRADPEFADAHQLLGDLLLAKSQARDAIPHYREAVRINPESGRAQLALGTALAATGDVDGAVPHLQKAAGGTDAATREQAAALLRQLGKEK
jgi:predicted CXXCH cytochrome family protein